ncbi:MAG: hypothetical protein QMD01_09075 [Thermodesulfovibrionales bacterium]|nr:hypothetical protein [Thermodesulfovibrionales bacterium]
MKKLAIVFAVLFVLSISAEAQMGQGMMMGEGMKDGQQMQMCPCPMMKQQMGEGQQMQMPVMRQMMGHGMMMQEMMQMMMDMMKMQRKMMRGMGPAERKEMMKEMDRMQERMERMMSMRMGMMMGMDSSQAKLECAEEWLKKAIDLHHVHIKDPKTATEASQLEMMEQMKKAYECIIGPISEPVKPLPKEPEKKEEAPKADPHKH